MVDNENEKDPTFAKNADDPRTATGIDPEVLANDPPGGIDSTEDARGEPGSRAAAGSVMDNSMPTDVPKEFPEDEPAQ